MPEIKGQAVALDFNTLLLVCAVIIAFFVLATTIRNGIEAVRGLSVRGRVKRMEEQIATINARLERGNRRFKAQSEDMGEILQTLHLLNLHFITGNDHDKLKANDERLTEYMSRRASRDAEEV